MAISDAESRVMQVLWASAPMSADDIVANLGDTGWHGKTIKTLINRLLGKGAIAAERDGRRYLYRPLLQEASWVSQQSRSLLDRLFGGRIAPMLAHFSRHEALSARDVAELRQLLADIDRNEGKP
jgi:predicted transcriptional regulator